MNRIRCHVRYPTIAKVEAKAIPRAGRGEDWVWSPKEDAILREHFPTASSEDIPGLPNRTGNAIRYRAALLGIKKDRAVLTKVQKAKRWATYEASVA